MRGWCVARAHTVPISRAPLHLCTLLLTATCALCVCPLQVRVLRIIRVIKLFIAAFGLKKGKEKEEEVQDEGAPSELSKALQGTIAKKTIVFVLVLLGGENSDLDNRSNNSTASFFGASSPLLGHIIAIYAAFGVSDLCHDLMLTPG